MGFEPPAVGRACGGTGVEPRGPKYYTADSRLGKPPARLERRDILVRRFLKETVARTHTLNGRTIEKRTIRRRKLRSVIYFQVELQHGEKVSHCFIRRVPKKLAAWWHTEVKLCYLFCFLVSFLTQRVRQKKSEAKTNIFISINRRFLKRQCSSTHGKICLHITHNHYFEIYMHMTTHKL